MATADLLVPTFRMNVMPNEAASKSSGRPIFDEMEVVEIRFPADRQKVAVFPAMDAEPNATREAIAQGQIQAGEKITYAEAYAKQYRQFKERQTQTVSGTPLNEVPFLTQAKRAELRALNIHTAEQLASLDGSPLKILGPGGRELKNQAIAYLDAARGSADVTALAAQVAALQQQLRDSHDLIKNYASTQKKSQYTRAVEKSVRESEAAAQEEVEAARARLDAAAEEVGEAYEAEQEPEESAPATKALEECTDTELKAFIKASGGEIKGNPSRETLIKRAAELATA